MLKLHPMKKYSLFNYTLFALLISVTAISCKAQNESRKTPESNLDRSIIPFINTGPEDQIAEYVRNIFEDKDGNLWMGTNGYGVARYDDNELKYFNESNGLIGSQVTDVMQAKDGKIWISTNGGLSVYDGKSFENYTVADGLSNEWMWSVYEDSKGQIWAGSPVGLSKMVGDKFETVQIPQNGALYHDSRFTNEWVRDFMEIDDELWLATAGQGICIYDGKKFRFINTDDGLCDNDISCFMKDSKGNIWIATRFGGTCMYDGKTFVTYDMENGIENNESIIVYEDKAGDIWFSSEGYGLYKFDGEKLTNYAKDEGLGVRAVQTVFEDSKGRFWTGGGGGLYRLYGDNFVNVTKNGPWEK